jgi:hypothetical protein
MNFDIDRQQNKKFSSTGVMEVAEMNSTVWRLAAVSHFIVLTLGSHGIALIQCVLVQVLLDLWNSGIPKHV